MTDFERMVSMMERVAVMRQTLAAVSRRLGELEQDMRELANVTPLRRDSSATPCCLARAVSVDAVHSTDCPAMR